MSHTAALDAADLTKSYAEADTCGACYEMLRSNPEIRAVDPTPFTILGASLIGEIAHYRDHANRYGVPSR